MARAVHATTAIHSPLSLAHPESREEEWARDWRTTHIPGHNHLRAGPRQVPKRTGHGKSAETRK